MKCINSGNDVFVENCEKCLSSRKADPLCFKRGFVWGTPDEAEPRWGMTIEEAKESIEDVSKYYDINWEGNSHLKPGIEIIRKITKERIPSDIRWIVWERDNFTCQHCGTRKHLSIDHIYPESKGGSLEISNLQTLCRSCNSKKGARV